MAQLKIMGDRDALEIEALAHGDPVELRRAADGRAQQMELAGDDGAREVEIAGEAAAIQIEGAQEARIGEGDVLGRGEAMQIDIAREAHALQRQLIAGRGIGQIEGEVDLAAGDMDPAMGNQRLQLRIEEQRRHEGRRELSRRIRLARALVELRHGPGADLPPDPALRRRPAGARRTGAVRRRLPRRARDRGRQSEQKEREEEEKCGEATEPESHSALFG